MGRIPAWLIILTIFLIGCAIFLLMKLKDMEINYYQVFQKHVTTSDFPQQVLSFTNEHVVEMQSSPAVKTGLDPTRVSTYSSQVEHKTIPIVVQSFTETANTSAAGIGEVLIVRGFASAVRGTGMRRQLGNKMPVLSGEILETAGGSRIKIKLTDKTQITLGEETAVAIDVYNYKPSEPVKCNIIVRMINGYCRILPGRIALINQHGFVVRTEVATFRLTGGDVCVICSKTGVDLLALDTGLNGVVTEYCRKGQQVMNVKTGMLIPVSRDEIIVQTITTTNTMFTVDTGKSSNLRTLDTAEALRIADLASIFSPISFNMSIAPEGIVFIPEGQEKR